MTNGGCDQHLAPQASQRVLIPMAWFDKTTLVGVEHNPGPIMQQGRGGQRQPKRPPSATVADLPGQKPAQSAKVLNVNDALPGLARAIGIDVMSDAFIPLLNVVRHLKDHPNQLHFTVNGCLPLTVHQPSLNPTQEAQLLREPSPREPARVHEIDDIEPEGGSIHETPPALGDGREGDKSPRLLQPSTEPTAVTVNEPAIQAVPTATNVPHAAGPSNPPRAEKRPTALEIAIQARRVAKAGRIARDGRGPFTGGR